MANGLYSFVILLMVSLTKESVVYISPEISFPLPYVTSQMHMVPFSTNKRQIEPMVAKAHVLNSDSVKGEVTFYQPHIKSPVFIVGKIKGLATGKYGVIITKFGSMTDTCAKTGPIFDIHYISPDYSLSMMNRPLGELGYVHSNNDNIADFVFSLDRISLIPGHPTNILGRGLAITMDYSITPMVKVKACGSIFAEEPSKSALFNY
ncbi:superoxide dismutase [Cu-Zn]-like [Daktulosphaira vitifoliae]|uniref:superoxide dismutase [Cu-Zn]-like n=1 Tax=Daktulosphaira vitifoliae TaxID=58002 RepID=UPI0021AAB1F3|nr:superoxide dismutase [Cu-Zn]-like [Daktulosphaira vitifoliae]XP_050531988.1 superoxide dismutase [Cu-Zn]-like [Daktulosphaira vitifoliae]